MAARTGLSPNARATLGIGRAFQNLALFHHTSVLDNIPAPSPATTAKSIPTSTWSTNISRA